MIVDISTQLRSKMWASCAHLCVSMVIAALAAGLVFLVWYPYPYSQLSGGRTLFFLLVAVDIIMGPLITFVVFNRRKPIAELRRDLSFVGLLQLATLVYGLWTVSLARPVHLVFEIDRFRVVHAVDVPLEMLHQIPKGITALPWTGPTLLGVRPFKDAGERADATLAALQGLQIGYRPDFWQPYSDSLFDVQRAAQPVASLQQRFPDEALRIDAALRKAGRTSQGMAYIPLVGRNIFWTVLVDPVSGVVLDVLPIDSF